MADQQHVVPRPGMGGDQVTGAAGFGHVDPTHGKAQRLQLGRNEGSDSMHARQVQRPAVLVPQSL